MAKEAIRIRASTKVSISTPFNFPESQNSGRTQLQFYAPLKSKGSIANVSRQIARFLVNNFPNTLVCNYSGTEDSDPTLAPFLGLQKSAPVGFMYGFPDFVPDFFYNHEYKIGGFVCEASTIPTHWVEICNKLDLIIVPSKFCQRVFYAAGVTKPIEIVPHGIESVYRPSQEHRPPVNEFIFFNAFADRFYQRKGAEELIRCFVEAFDAKSQVKLLLHADKAEQTAQLVKRYGAENHVRFTPDQALSTQDFANLYSQVHATVHPTRGEGFGLIPMQSLACGTPVLVPHHTGLVDHIDQQNIIKLDIDRIEPSFHSSGIMLDAGHRVNEDHLVKQMRHVYHQWDTEKTRATNASKNVRDSYAWDKVLNSLHDLLPF